MGTRIDRTVAVLNGLVGDYLAATDNGLATELGCYHLGQPLPMETAALRRAHPEAGPRVVLLVHGLLVDEHCFRFTDGSDYGTRLQRDLGLTPLYLRYNSGAKIADNGQALAELLVSLHAAWPVPLRELVLIGYSMGGLVIRSACHVASARRLPWLPNVQRACYLGTPHLGAPAERMGRLLARALRAIPDPYTRLVGEVSDLRSRGIKDLGDAALGPGVGPPVTSGAHPVPLLSGIRHTLIAGSLWMDGPVANLFGDAVVPLGSATGKRLVDVHNLAIPEDQVHVLEGRNHLQLSCDDDVYRILAEVCADA